ncbi:mRNA cleavage and polyadenylation factor subunit [Coemansia sp. RSA 1821]|nr:mRNA cleavage and polyadenylation factor subunit [Coemansia sp. RSA 1821]
MRDPVYTYCREVLPPSVVERAVSLSFTRPGASNLAVARGNVLELYEIGLVLNKVGSGGDEEGLGDQYQYRDTGAEEFDLPMLREEHTTSGARGKDTKKPQLQLVGRWSLHGKIMDLQPVQHGKTRVAVDQLLLSFAEAKMSLVSFDTASQSITTESIHYYEHESLKQRTLYEHQKCELRADPDGRCAALHVYDDQLAILPFAVPGDARAVKPYADSFVVNMRNADVGVRNIHDFVFLSGYLEPTLALLHEQEPTWPGRMEEERDSCTVTIVSLDLTRSSVSVLSATPRLPYDCSLLLPIPEPVGGVLVLGSNTITHVANGTISCISLLNHAAKHGIGSSMQNYIDDTNVDLELVLNPHGSECAVASPNTVILWTQHGRVFLLRLAGNGRLIKRIVAKQIAGTDIRKDPRSLSAPSWDDIAILPSCVAKMRIVYDEESADLSDEQLLFVGGNSGRSLLLGIRDSHASARTAGSADQVLPLDDEVDIDTDVYGDSIAPNRLQTNGNASNERSSRSDRWAESFSITVYDEIVGTGTMCGMDIGAAAANATGNMDNLELVTCLGNEWRGSLCVQQRHVVPEIVASFDLPGEPVRGVWTVRCLREYNIGGVMQAQDSATLVDLNDTFMVVTRDNSTSVFAAGDELHELERTGFYSSGPTIDVGEVLGYTRVVQVHAQGLRIVNASGREVQSIGFDEGQQAVFAEIADPYVLVRMQSGDAVVFEASSDSGQLREMPVPSFFAGGDIVAVSLFEDVNHVLSTNKEWAERNKDTLTDQAHASGGQQHDGDFDSLYADASASRKRKRAQNQDVDRRRSRRKHEGDEFDDLYDEADADAEGSVENQGDHDDDGARPEDVRGDSPMFLLALTASGDLNILRMPQFGQVWMTLRLDNLADTLSATHKVEAPGSDSDSDDGAALVTPLSAGLDLNYGRNSHIFGAGSGRRIDQLRLVQLGGDNISDTHLIILTTAGEIAVYRAFEYCTHEYAVQRAAAASQARPTADAELQFAGDDELALRFVRIQHDVLAYNPEYQHKVRRVQIKQARAFADWKERSKEKRAFKTQEQQEAHKRAQEKQKREEEMAEADWSDGSEDEAAADAKVGNAENNAAEATTTSVEAVDDIYADDSTQDAAAAVPASQPQEETPLETYSEPEAPAVNDDELDDDLDGMQVYPLEHTRKISVLDNLGGYQAVLVAGMRPVVVLVGSKRYARVHPMRLPVRLPPSLQPADSTGKIDAVEAGLLTECRPLVAMARFHSNACAHGVVAVTQAGTLVISRLPVSVRAARGGIEFDSAWPVRCIPVGTIHGGVSTQGGATYHAASGSYLVAAATPSQFYIREPNPEIAFRDAKEAADAGGRPAPLPRTVIPEYQRKDLHTTSAPPLVARHSIDLLSPVTWETIDSHTLDEHEHIAVMRTLELDSAQAEGGRRALVCVGTGFVLGEDVMTRGRVYVFDVVDVVPQPGRPQTNRRLKLLYTEEIHGTVTTLGELRGSLVMSEGSKLFVRAFGGDTLTSFAFLDCQAWVRAAVGMRNFLLIADANAGLSFVGLQEENPARLQVLGRDPHASLPVECADFLVMGTQLQLLAADTYGNLHVYAYAPRDMQSFGGQRLLRRGEFGLGARAVSLRRVVAADGRHVCVVGTATGSVHVLALVPETTFKRLHRISAQLVHGVPPLAGLNPREFRAVPLRLRQNQAPRRTVLDADLLVPLYAHGPSTRQRDAAQRNGTTVDRVLRDISATERVLNLF